MIPVKYLKEKHHSVVGNKAANFGELQRMTSTIDFKTPESAFAIPFTHYYEHATKSGAIHKINALLSKDNLSRTSSDIRTELETIQKDIMDTPVTSLLLNRIEKMILRLGDHKRMRFRSSTNAEDRKGFSGAGLYTSKTGELYNDDKPIDLAIKKVWASLWSYDAFMERLAFNIQQENVMMGILVHRSFPNEEVNGVAVTTNIYRENYLGFVVNAQIGNENVVAPNSGVQCDQFICYPKGTNGMKTSIGGGIDVINYSSLNQGNLVMTTEEIQDLADVLEQIKRRYLLRHYTEKSYYEFGLDLEFKLDAEARELYIKQMRIYNN